MMQSPGWRFVQGVVFACTLVGCSDGLLGSAGDFDAGGDAGAVVDGQMVADDGGDASTTNDSSVLDASRTDASVGDASVLDGAIEPTVCDETTFEFPPRSGSCVHDPCEPDPCGGTSACSNVTGEAVCTPCTHFVDAESGDDDLAGTSVATAWRSLRKVSATSFAEGATVCFRKGQTFAGTLEPASAGTSAAPIRFASFGDGEAPVISGFVEVSGWTRDSGSVWSASCPDCAGELNLVTVDDVPEAMGRTPNADAAWGGYLSIDSTAGPPGTSALYSGTYAGPWSITDAELPAGDWAGAEVVIRKVSYGMERAVVTSQSGTTLSYADARGTIGTFYRPQVGWGYFLENARQTLDRFGEWYFDRSTKVLYVHFGTDAPTDHVVRAAKETNAFRSRRNYVELHGLVFEGANETNVLFDNVTGGRLSNSEVRFAGDTGVYLLTATDTTVTRSVVRDAHNAGIYSHRGANNRIEYTDLHDIGMRPGMGDATRGDGDYSGIFAYGRPADVLGFVVDGNVVDRVGYNGVHFVASGVTVSRNRVTNFTQVLDDGGGVYTWRGTSGEFTDRHIVDNVVIDGGRPADGKPAAVGLMTSCVYIDEHSMQVEVRGNTLSGCSRAGLLVNWAYDNVFAENTIFDNDVAQVVLADRDGMLRRNTFVDNVVVAPDASTWVMSIWGLRDVGIELIGSFDRNHYVRPTENDLIIQGATAGVLGRMYDLAAWREAFPYDDASSATPVVYRTREVVTVDSDNLIDGGDFESGIPSGQFSYFENGTQSVTIDDSGLLGGGSSLRVAVGMEANRYVLIHRAVGTVAASDSYVMRLRTLGTTEHGIVRGALRQTRSPYSEITPSDIRAFGTAAKEHEFVLVTTEATEASYLVNVHGLSGPAYVDDIELYRATTREVDVRSKIRFEVNATSVPRVVSLERAYVDARGVERSGSVTIEPFGSAVLFER